jgi:Kae1-associated kinase Bud32
MQKPFYWKGAEAELTEKERDGEKALSKKRIPKGYRHPQLDADIRKSRTRGEAKLIRAASSSIRVPRIFSVDEKGAEILMEFVEGKMLKEAVENEKELCIEAGKEIRRLHDLGIIHGDLTTSNIIVIDEKADRGKGSAVEGQRRHRLCFVDFGLGYFSKRVEDKATDLIVFKKTFNATHSSLAGGWELVMKGYEPSKEMTERMAAIEKRARYH